MSETLYTCDYCVGNGHDEVSCHRDYELSRYGEEVVCDGCRECGDFPEFDDPDIVLTEFIPPDKERIATLEAACLELEAENARLREGLAGLSRGLGVKKQWAIKALLGGGE